MLVQFILMPSSLGGTGSSCTIQHVFMGRKVSMKLISLVSDVDVSLIPDEPLRLDFSEEFRTMGAYSIVAPSTAVSAGTRMGFFFCPSSAASKLTFAPPVFEGYCTGHTLTLSVCDFDLPYGGPVGAGASTAINQIIVSFDVNYID